MKIIRLEAENVKRLRAIDITPNGNRVILSGKNANGKTSILDSIEMALGGKDAMPAMPIRQGARKAHIVLDLGDLVVERTFSAKGTQLVVRNKDGESQPGPQGLLDKLCGRLCLDPLSFARASAKKQDEVLKQLLGLDFSELDADRQRIYDSRTALNRSIAEKEALHKAMARHPGAPKGEISVADLAKQIATAQEHAHARRSAEEAVARQEADVGRSLAHVDQLKAQLKVAEDKYQADTRVLVDLREAFFALAPNQDTTDLQRLLDTAEATNKQVRENAAREALDNEARELVAKADACTDAIDAIDEKKKAALAAADFPVPGLGFDDLGPTLNGIPLEQCSQADKFKLSSAITMKQNPDLKILLLRQAESLDDESWTFLYALAEEHDFQVWVEVVKSDDPEALVISDGEIVGATASTAAE